MIKRKPPLTPYVIEWRDAMTDPNWRPYDDICNDKNPLSNNVEYGIIIRKDKKIVIIGHGYGKESFDISSTLAIPRSWIKSMRRLVVNKKSTIRLK